MPRSDIAELPWGSHLRIEPRGQKPPVFVDDETGAEWTSIREAFWVGHLRGKLEYGNVPHSKLELMHAVLAAILRRKLDDLEHGADLFGGNSDYGQWYMHWLHAEGMVKVGTNGSEKLTASGMSVLHMLAATRPRHFGPQQPSGITIRQLSGLGVGSEARDVRLAQVERAAAGWGRAFVRKWIGARSAVVLLRRGAGPIPMLQMVWSLTFAEEEQRDVFYEWLCLRLDRWDAWADLVVGDSAGRLTHKLLMVMAASLGRKAVPLLGHDALAGAAGQD